jgi:hypothetical protein
MTITPEEIEQRKAASRERKRQKELDPERIEKRLEVLFERPEWIYDNIADYYLGFGHHLCIRPSYTKNHNWLLYSICLDNKHISNITLFTDLMDASYMRCVSRSNLVPVIQRAYRFAQLSSFA